MAGAEDGGILYNLTDPVKPEAEGGLLPNIFPNLLLF